MCVRPLRYRASMLARSQCEGEQSDERRKKLFEGQKGKKVNYNSRRVSRSRPDGNGMNIFSYDPLLFVLSLLTFLFSIFLFYSTVTL